MRKTKTNKFMVFFLAVMMIALMFQPMAAFATPAEGSKIDIGGEQNISLSANAGNLTSKGWAWNASTDTLTLDSNYTGKEIYIVCGVSDNINLVLNGDVTITSSVWGINVVSIDYSSLGGSLTVKAGSYTLNVTSNTSGLQAHGGVFIKSGTVVATGDIHGICSYYGGVTISDTANVTAIGNGLWSNGIQAAGDVIINTTGTVVAGGNEFCGIATDGSIQIAGGTVTAKGRDYGALNANNNIAITGGTVTTDNTAGGQGGDVYGNLNISGAGTNVTVNGDIDGDLTVSGAGANVTVNGSILNGGRLTVSGGTVNVTGTVGVGDVNGDGKVNIADLICLSQYLSAVEPGSLLKAADVNNDGKVNIDDLVRLARWIAEIDSKPLGKS